MIFTVERDPTFNTVQYILFNKVTKLTVFLCVENI